MPYTEQGKAVMLFSLAASISHMSLHSSGDVSADNELTGGVYRRLQVDFREPNEGAMRSSREVSFEVPQGAAVRGVGFWTTSFGGTLLAWDAVPEKIFRGRGTVVVDLAKLDLNCEVAT